MKNLPTCGIYTTFLKFTHPILSLRHLTISSLTIQSSFGLANQRSNPVLDHIPDAPQSFNCLCFRVQYLPFNDLFRGNSGTGLLTPHGNQTIHLFIIFTILIFLLISHLVGPYSLYHIFINPFIQINKSNDSGRQEEYSHSLFRINQEN